MSDTVYQAFAAQKRQNFLQGIPRNAEIEGRTDFIFMSKNGRPLMPGAVNNVLYNIVAAYNRQEAARAEKENRGLNGCTRSPHIPCGTPDVRGWRNRGLT